MKWVQWIFVACFFSGFMLVAQESSHRGRARDFGLQVGILPTGKWNAITDIKGVMVGHTSLVQGDSVRTGITVVIPHSGNVFMQKVPAAVYVSNGFGKSIGLSQIEELGTLETPIALTNTLSVPAVAEGMLDYMLNQPGNENVRSINSVVGETNDGYLNDIRGKHIRPNHLLQALETASSGPVKEGNVGAGVGTRAFGYKGGIGTASRVLPPSKGGYSVGVLVQSNFGGVLRINGAPVGRELDNFYMMQEDPHVADGSIMIIIATDAPLSDRNLKRLARRSYLALGVVGSFSSNGSGDYSIAFSTHPDTFVPNRTPDKPMQPPVLHNNEMSPLFLAVLEATEEAIYNSLFMAQNATGHKGRALEAIPIDKVLPILEKYKALYQDRLPKASVE